MIWIPLNTEAQLTEIVSLSHQTPVLIFKHSTRCSISDSAKAKLERHWDSSEHSSIEKAYCLDLLNFRPISSKIADIFGVDHQSPQALLIKNGKCVYHNSHMAILFKDILAQTL